MTSKKVNFTTAREKLSALIDEVQQSGRPVTITKRGRPAAVLIHYDVFEQRVAKRKKSWRLEGSGIVVKGVDIDKALREQSEFQAQAWEERMHRRSKLLGD